MAIKQYLTHLRAPTKDAQLTMLKEQTYSTKGLLTMLGDYWVNYYKDTQSLSQAASGYVTTIGKHLTRTFELIRSGNILDIPPEQYDPFELLLFKRSDVQTVYDAEGNVDYLYIPLTDTKINSIEYLTTSLFESDVVLCKNDHFSIIPGDGIYFYVDIFNDPAISTYSYHMGEGAEQSVLLWGNKIVLSSYYIYQRYGRFLYKKASDSYQYKWIVTSLMRYYSGAKTCNNIRDILDILFGIPYARYDNETIKELTYTDSNLEDWWSQYHHEESSYVRIVTDKATYYSYATSTLKYQVGDTVKKNELFCKFSKVLDYIVSPKWWITDAKTFPENMFVDGDNKKFTREEKHALMDLILKYNTVYLQLNIDYDSYSLFKNLIKTIRELIKTGFPVYLNPYTEVDLHCLLLDKTEFEERWAHSDWLLQLAGDLTLIDKYFEIFRYEGAHYYNGDYAHKPFLYTSGYIGESLVFHTGAVFRDLFSFARKYNGKYWYEGQIYHRASTCEDRCIVNLRWHKPWEDPYDLLDKTHELLHLSNYGYVASDKFDEPDDYDLTGSLHSWFEDKYLYTELLRHDEKYHRSGIFRYDTLGYGSSAMGNDAICFTADLHLEDSARRYNAKLKEYGLVRHDSTAHHDGMYTYAEKVPYQHDAPTERDKTQRYDAGTYPWVSWELQYRERFALDEMDASVECTEPLTEKVTCTESTAQTVNITFSDDTREYDRLKHDFKYMYSGSIRYDGMRFMARNDELEVTTKLVYLRGVFDAQDKYAARSEQAGAALKMAIAEQVAKAADTLKVAETLAPVDKFTASGDAFGISADWCWEHKEGFEKNFVDKVQVHLDNVKLIDDVSRLYPVVHDFTYKYNKRAKYKGCESWVDDFAFGYGTAFDDTFAINREDTLVIDIHKV